MIPEGPPPPSRTDPAAPAEDSRTAWADFDAGTYMVAEFISAILVWGGFGWLADRWLGTTPWLLAVGGLLGAALGFHLMYVRSAGMLRSPSAQRTLRQPEPTIDEGTAHGNG